MPGTNTSLLRKSVDYGRSKLYDTGPRRDERVDVGGATTVSIMTLSIATLSITSYSIMARNVIALNLATLGILVSF